MLLKQNIGIVVEKSGEEAEETTSGKEDNYDPADYDYDPEAEQQKMLDEVVKGYQKSYKMGRFERDLWNVPENRGKEMLFNIKEYWERNASMTPDDIRRKLMLSLAENRIEKTQEEKSEDESS